MATNDFEIQVDTDDYDLFGAQGHTTPLPGTPTVDPSGHLIIPSDPFFSPSTIKNSTMDKDPRNTGPTTSFWEYYPLSIDVDGYIFYYNENTGINVRGPGAIAHITWDELTPAQRESLKGKDGADGANGVNGRDGTDGRNGYDAYQLWLINNGWQDHPEEHPISDFYAYLANLSNAIIQEGTGTGSLILNYRGQSGSVASGAGASAFGNQTTASGTNAIAMGNNTIAGYQNQLVIGKYNQNKQTSVFEIGNGTDTNTRSNLFEIDTNGNIITSGTITDGGSNTLSNKVDKINGKQLSTYDFNDQYKGMLDNYHVDSSVSALSDNPVSGNAVYNALLAATSSFSKPEQIPSVADEDLCFFHPSDTLSETLDAAKFTTSLTWNPGKQILKNSNSDVTHSNTFAFGTNLISGANNQILFGNYNEGYEGNILEIGGGYSNERRLNLLSLNENGDITSYGDVVDGYGNVLSEKQNQLGFDQTITQNSENIVTSGVIYDYLTSHGIDPEGGIVVPGLDSLQNQITQLGNLINQLQAQITAIGDPRILTDELYLDRTYTYGVYDGEFYIKRIEENEDEDDEEEEPEV